MPWYLCENTTLCALVLVCISHPTVRVQCPRPMYCINCAALLLKFGYSQKVTKCEKISLILKNYLLTSKQSRRYFFQNFVAFSEYLNFTAAVCIHPVLLGLFYTSTYILPRRMPRNAKFAHICISGKTCLRIELLNSPKQYLTSHRAYFILDPKAMQKFSHHFFSQSFL